MESETQNLNPNVNIQSKCHNNEEIVKFNSNKVLKRKVTEDGVAIERVLSEGEASSGFETVSSTDSKIDINELDLSSADEHDYNIIVKVKNELAFQNKNRPGKKIHSHEIRSKSSHWQSHKLDCFLNEFTSQRHNGFGNSRESKYRQRKNVDKNYNYGRRDRESSVRKNFDYSRQRAYNNEWSTYRDQVRIQRSRWDDTYGRTKRSRSKEHTGRLRGSRSTERIVRNRSPNYKDTKTESRRSGSFERNSAKSNSERSFPPGKIKPNSFSKAFSSFARKRTEDRKSSNNIKKKEINNDKKPPRNSSPPRKKGRQLFLVGLEKKLEAGRLRNSQPESNEVLDQTNTSKKELALISALPGAANQSFNSSFPSMYAPPALSVEGAFCPGPYTSTPAVSVNNLPLVAAGPTGLPVCITATGEQIPHDMDGRPIHVGPNGFYFPVDPTGRIFAHIVSPENQAVPIHMTEDGVLRLPNSEPVLFNPTHQFPVNADGKVIPVEPDRKPLFACPNLPNKPPLNLVQMMDSSGNDYVAQTMPSPRALQLEDQELVQIKTENQGSAQLPVVDLNLLNLIRNPSEEINKAESLNTYKKKAQEKSEDVLKGKEIEKNLGVNPSKRGVRRSIPIKLSQKKTSKDDPGSSSSDMILDSSDCDSASKTVMEPNKNPIEEIILNSDDEQDTLEIICVEEVSKAQNLKVKFKNYITEKIQRAIQLLCEKNHRPPVVGRFIISDVNLVPSMYDSPNESPLLRNRIHLSFVTPNISLNDQPITVKDTQVNFQFVSQKKSSQKRENHSTVKQKNLNPPTLPVFTFDFAMQCDFTSEVIRNLSFKVSQLEMEVARLKRINVNLFDDYKNVQTAKQNKALELKKALLEIQEKNNEIRSLKGLMETPK